jgi:SAM-dependent methyltransferase
MPDAIFAEPRLAEIYDFVDSDRSDLDVYLALAEEFDARSVLDLGCGTGTFACLLAKRGIDVAGVGPAAASIDVARRKPCADRVRWLVGDAVSLPPLQVDLVTMTGNVAQVFLGDEEWTSTLRAHPFRVATGRPVDLRGQGSGEGSVVGMDTVAVLQSHRCPPDRICSVLGGAHRHQPAVRLVPFDRRFRG